MMRGCKARYAAISVQAYDFLNRYGFINYGFVEHPRSNWGTSPKFPSR
jgi:hypothetical protein